MSESWAEREQREAKWLQGLKAGDSVAFSPGRWGDLRIATVERVTSTQVVVEGMRYRRVDGRAVGGSTWNRTSICEPTPELLAEIEERELRREVGAVDWRKLSLAKVKEVLKVLRTEGSDERPNAG